MNSTLYLGKDNDELISWCTCAEALIAVPRQVSCPWCGCGWLFSCIKCRKSFTFARGIRVDATLEELIRQDAANFCETSDFAYAETEIREMVDWMQERLQDIEDGRQYVYFDGMFVPTDAPHLVAQGEHRSHQLDFVPQVRALVDPSVEERILTNVSYWQQGRA